MEHKYCFLNGTKLYVLILENSPTYTFTVPKITICQRPCSGFQRITFKTENNHLANIDSCRPLELCLSTGQIIASSLCICRNQVIGGLSLVIFFSCGPPASEVFLFIAKFKVHLQWLVLLAPWTGRPSWEGRRVVVM